MYSATAANKCSSACMDIKTSRLVERNINIYYEEMPKTCLIDKEITITCLQFYNPITPTVWTGFSLTTKDAEIDSKIIE
jgi:hypothetical protein